MEQDDEKSALRIFLLTDLDAPTTDIKSHYSNGSTSSVRCSADGYPTPQFIWSKNSVDKSKTAILLFDTILVADAGNYKCVAKNVLGSKDTTVNVNVTCEFSAPFALSTFLKVVK